MRFKISLLFLLALSPIYLKAQNEENIWFFGDSAGISFNSGKPGLLLGSKIATWEGCSTISDSLGNLLFYTDGEKV